MIPQYKIQKRIQILNESLAIKTRDAIQELRILSDEISTLDGRGSGDRSLADLLEDYARMLRER